MEEQQDLLHIGEYVKQRWKVVCFILIVTTASFAVEL